MAKPVDRVQLSKQESAAGGGDAADSDDFLHSPLEPNEDAPEVQGLFIQPPAPSVVRDELVYVTRDGAGNMIFRDDVDATERTLSALLVGGGGLTENSHRTIRQLIHFIEDGPAEGFASGAFKETLPSGSIFPTSEIWWESSSKLKKIISLDTTWTGVTITQEVWKIYDTDGSTALATVTDTISYSGIFETSRTRTIA